MIAVYVPVEILKLLKVLAIERRMGDVVKEAVIEMIEKGCEAVFDRKPNDLKKILVDDDTHYLLNRLRVELDYRTIGEVISDAVVSYAVRRGLAEECIEKIFSL